MSENLQKKDLPLRLREVADDYCPSDPLPRCEDGGCRPCLFRSAADEIERLRELLNATGARNRTLARANRRRNAK